MSGNFKPFQLNDFALYSVASFSAVVHSLFLFRTINFFPLGKMMFLKIEKVAKGRDGKELLII